MAVGDGFHPVQCFEVSSQDEAETEEFVRQMYVGNRSRLGAGRAGARRGQRIDRGYGGPPLGMGQPRQFATVYQQRFGVVPSQTLHSRGHRR